jgi:putative endonuclease
VDASAAASNSPDQEFVGASEDLKRSIPEHDAGKSSHISKFRPWQFVW